MFPEKNKTNIRLRFILINFIGLKWSFASNIHQYFLQPYFKSRKLKVEFRITVVSNIQVCFTASSSIFHICSASIPAFYLLCHNFQDTFQSFKCSTGQLDIHCWAYFLTLKVLGQLLSNMISSFGSWVVLLKWYDKHACRLIFVYRSG